MTGLAYIGDALLLGYGIGAFARAFAFPYPVGAVFVGGTYLAAAYGVWTVLP